MITFWSFGPIFDNFWLIFVVRKLPKNSHNYHFVINVQLRFQDQPNRTQHKQQITGVTRLWNKK